MAFPFEAAAAAAVVEVVFVLPQVAYFAPWSCPSSVVVAVVAAAAGKPLLVVVVAVVVAFVVETHHSLVDPGPLLEDRPFLGSHH